jgi:hypothetical protein
VYGGVGTLGVGSAPFLAAFEEDLGSVRGRTLRFLCCTANDAEREAVRWLFGSERGVGPGRGRGLCRTVKHADGSVSSMAI